MRDLPSGSGLLALARDLLLRDLLPLLPPEEHFDARLIANSMAIAEREALAGDAPRNEIILELRIFYGDRSLTHPALRAGSPLSRNAGEGPERSEGGEGEQGLLRRFAGDLRAGEFERSGARDRNARDILWRLTIAKLRSANPRFLNANGFS
jgi:Domain of unknown function (DUF6285)